MISAMDVPVCISRSQELARNANSGKGLRDKMYPVIVCVLKCGNSGTVPSRSASRATNHKLAQIELL